MYILFNENTNVEEIINFLQELGFTESPYSSNERKGICTCIIPFQGITNYTFLGGNMLSTDPYVSWIHCRKKCNTFEEFKEGVKSKLYENSRNK